MDSLKQISWYRVLIAGFLAEASVFALLIPFYLIWGQPALLYAAPPVSLLMCFLFGVWSAQRAKAQFVLHGTLVGVVAMALYVILTLFRPEPVAYIVAHGLKLLGGAAGGGSLRLATTVRSRLPKRVEALAS